jgi:predicted HTH transcriptional regulator
MSPADLRRLVKIGEGSHLEFKRRVSSPARIAREAVALANTWGGTILIGVDDDGSITGVKDTEEELFDLRRAFANHCTPELPLVHEIVPISRKRDVIVATVKESQQKPHSHLEDQNEAEGDILVRVNEHTVVASPERIALMKHERSAEGVRFEFGDKELLLLRYLETYDAVGVNEFARMAHIPRTEASATLIVLTRAGVTQLISGEKGDMFVLNHQKNEATAI